MQSLKLVEVQRLEFDKFVSGEQNHFFRGKDTSMSASQLHQK